MSTDDILYTAISKEDFDTVKDLISRGVVRDDCDGLNLTPLYASTINKDSKIAKILLDNGADPLNQMCTIYNGTNPSPLFVVLVTGDIDKVQLMLNYIPRSKYNRVVETFNDALMELKKDSKEFLIFETMKKFYDGTIKQN